MFYSFSAWAKAILAAIVLSLLPAVAHADRFVEAMDPVQWQVANAETVEGNGEYQLHNLRRRSLNFSSQLGYVRGKKCKDGTITVECELGWPAHSGGHFVFVRHDKSNHNPISDTEIVAIYNTLTKRYLIYNNSIVPRFSSRQAFEWMLRHRKGVDFALYNTNADSYLIKSTGHDEQLQFLRITPR